MKPGENMIVVTGGSDALIDSFLLSLEISNAHLLNPFKKYLRNRSWIQSLVVESDHGVVFKVSD